MAKSPPKSPEKETLRIRRYNELNWVIERWDHGGVEGKGIAAGTTTKPGWKSTDSYFPLFKHACQRVIDECLKDDNQGEAMGWEQCLAAVKAAEARTARIVSKALDA